MNLSSPHANATHISRQETTCIAVPVFVSETPQAIESLASIGQPDLGIELTHQSLNLFCVDVVGLAEGVDSRGCLL